MKDQIKVSRTQAEAFADNEIEEGRADASERQALIQQFDRAAQDDKFHPVAKGEKNRVQLLKDSQLSRPLTPQAKARQNELLSHTALGRQILNGAK